MDNFSLNFANYPRKQKKFTTYCFHMNIHINTYVTMVCDFDLNAKGCIYSVHNVAYTYIHTVIYDFIIIGQVAINCTYVYMCLFYYSNQ